MTSLSIDQTVTPSRHSLIDIKSLLRTVSARRPARIVGPDGTEIALPPELYSILKGAVDALADGQAVNISTQRVHLTTNEAAEMLGVTRPTLVKLLESGKIPYEQPGTHRRVLLVDVLNYRKLRSEKRSKALDEIVRISEEADLYRKTSNFNIRR